ncbi:MAG: 4-vinyl reductase [Pseudobdellovibrio sp.]
MSYEQIKFTLDVDHRRCILGNEPMIFHCHHYNNYLQRTIVEDAPYIDSSLFLIGAAAEVSYAQFTQLFKTETVEQRKAFVELVFKWAGFGLINLKDITDKGGKVSTPVTHYSRTWATKFGPSEKPVDFFTTGWIAGALSAIYGKDLGAYSAKQTKCITMTGTKENEYSFAFEKANYNIYKSVGIGTLTTHKLISVEVNNVNYDGILGALSQMPIVGNDEGMIPAFGVYLTRHYANYYNRISFEFVREMMTKFGQEGVDAAEPLLIEAGHQCAFNTFGGIMTSKEWDALILPQLKSKEDWVHGIVACVNALGWGRWQVTNVSKAGADFTLHDDYESVGFQAMYGQSKSSISYLAEGGVSGILDLVYLGDIHNKPTLDPAFYAKLFKGTKSYTSKVVTSRAKGDAATKIEVRF